MQIVITGCSGLIGSALVEHFFSLGHSIHCLQRNKNDDGLIWNPEKIDQLYKDGKHIDAVVHLAGENIASGRWTGKKKKRILRSRIQGTHEIASYFSNLNNPPKVMIFASAIGYYGSRGNEKLTEETSLGTGFLAEVCQKWEEAAELASEAGIRTVYTRFGMVLSPQGGALQKMVPPFKAGLGGRIGNGKQYMSWISIRDLVSAVTHLLDNDELSGPFNIVSPTPVTNSEFTRSLGRAVQRHTIFPVPGMVIKTVFGSMGNELLLSSSRVFPEKLLASGFTFRYTTLKETLQHCVDIG